MRIVLTYKWRLGLRRDHCPMCADHDGQVRTTAEWSITGAPPLHHGCGCRLVPNDYTEVATDITPPSLPANPNTPPGIADEIPAADPNVGGENNPNPPPNTPPTVIITPILRDKRR